MYKRLLALLLIVMMLPLTALATEGATDSFYAYFKDARWMRTEPKANTPTVMSVPERTLVKLTPVDEKYAHAVCGDKEGYVYYRDYVPVDYTDPHSENAVTVEGFFDAPVRMRRSPIANAPNVAVLPTDVRFAITLVTDEYAYLTFEGEEGYVHIGDFMQMDYKKGQVEPYTAFCAEETPAYDSPCYGASIGQMITPYSPITVDGFDGDHVTILYNGQRLYIAGSELMRLSEDFEVEDFEAVVAKKGDVLAFPLEHSAVAGAVKKNDKVTVNAFHGEYAHVSAGEVSGYVHYSLLKSSKETEKALAAFEEQVKRLEAQRFLNVAFTMLEESNPVLNAYNNNCGGTAVARFKYGCPYLFAGMNASSLLKPRFCSQNSNYYSTEKRYLGGFDCIGFARWVHNQVGMKKLPAISDTQKAPKSRLVNVKNIPSAQWADKMEVGDCINMAYKGGGYHVMIYVGTLRDFGFTQESVGAELAPYLDNPLVIHCGMNNFHTAWYTEYIAAQSGMSSVNPPDGGVTISILGIPYDECPSTETMWKGTKNVKTFYWFDLQGYNLTVLNPDVGTRWFTVYRNSEK